MGFLHYENRKLFFSLSLSLYPVSFYCQINSIYWVYILIVLHIMKITLRRSLENVNEAKD